MRQTTMDVYPVGAVIALGASTITNDLWLPCDGRLVSKAQYPELFDALGYTYGTGGTADEFGLPDYRGRFQRGAATVGSVGKIENWSTKKPGTVFSGTAYWLPDSQQECNALNYGAGSRDDGTLTLISCTQGGDKETRPVNVYVDHYVKVRLAVGNV